MKVGYQGVKNSYSESLFNKFKNDYKLDNFGIDDLEHTDETPPVG